VNLYIIDVHTFMRGMWGYQNCFITPKTDKNCKAGIWTGAK